MIDFMNKFRGGLLCLTLALGLSAGCASVSPTYYTLDMTPSGTVEKGPHHLVAAYFTVGEALTSRQIMIKKSPVEVEYYAASEWAAGLDKLVSEKLQAEWGGRAGQERALDVSGVIQAFEQIDMPDGADAHVRLAIAIRNAGESRYSVPLLEKVYHCRTSAAAATSLAVVEALNQCLEQIAAEIAADAAGL